MNNPICHLSNGVARQLGQWARAAVIHGAGGEAEHYRGAVALAERFGRLAFVECVSEQVPAWAAHLPCSTKAIIIPRGGVHPIVPEGATQ